MLSRREVLFKIGGGFGALGLASLFADAGLLASESKNTLAPKPPHFPPRARHVIFLFMNGGPSHVDTFDPKPALKQYEGQTPQAIQTSTGRKKRGGLTQPSLNLAKLIVHPDTKRLKTAGGWIDAGGIRGHDAPNYGGKLARGFERCIPPGLNNCTSDAASVPLFAKLA